MNQARYEATATLLAKEIAPELKHAASPEVRYGAAMGLESLFRQSRVKLMPDAEIVRILRAQLHDAAGADNPGDDAHLWVLKHIRFILLIPFIIAAVTAVIWFVAYVQHDSEQTERNLREVCATETFRHDLACKDVTK